MTVAESSTAKSQLGAGLKQGIDTLSLDGTVTFALYVKTILPLDGYVFWVNANLLSPTQIAAAIAKGGVTYPSTPANSITVKGSLHHATDLTQSRNRFGSVNYLVFSAESEVTDFNYVNPYLMYVATIDGVEYAFKKQANYYQQADVYHYSGEALYSTMDSQLIDSLTGFDQSSVIVSNSLPIWLGMNTYTGPTFVTVPFPIYPSFLAPQNEVPPYATIHIGEDDTTPIQGYPYVGPTSSQYQLTKDIVTVELYGVRNNDALQFQQNIYNYSLFTDNIGILNCSVMRDAKENQTEFGIIAQKKVITFEVSYYQQNVLTIAQKLITEAFITLTP